MRSGFPHGLSSGEISRSFFPLDQLAPALTKAGSAFALSWLETLRDCLRLFEVFGRGAPEEQASGDASHGDRGVELLDHAEDAVFHGGRAYTLRKCDARRSVAQRLEFLLEGVIELRVHPGAAAHGAGLC
jgi:hypothetical protein